MDDIKHPNDFPPLSSGQIHDLATAVREGFGGDLSREAFTEKLLLFLEDVPGFEAGDVDARLIESIWETYSGRLPES
ncbi:hypothetical protein [Burkholderia contaminans]|uniref:hypothetical protein n=1 Tax=Burkholderia contaminans TaxID=488447 RepID=UPI0015884B14|nr:hypothetical protein [Burkholderia contaminans]